MNDTKRKCKWYERIKTWQIVTGLVVIIVVLACFLLLRSDSAVPTEPESTSSPTDEASDIGQFTTQTTEDTEQAVEDLLVETPFCTLHYPGKWSDCVRTEHTDLGYGYVVRFYATCDSGTQELFSVLFGFATENASYAGTITCNNISTDVNLETTVFTEADSWTAEDANKIRAMQADIDYLIGKLTESPFFDTDHGESSNVVIPTVIDDVIETPYALLRYSSQWKDAMRWETVLGNDGYAVTFFGTVNGKEFPLFTFSFQSSDDNGIRVGTIQHEDKEVGVYLTLHDAPLDENWTDAEQHLFAELQEQAYYVLDNLPENPNYVSVMS